MGYFGENPFGEKDKRHDDGIMWLLLLGLLLVVGAGPATIAEKSKESFGFRVFLWLLIRSFWFGAGLLTYHLFMK